MVLIKACFRRIVCLTVSVVILISFAQFTRAEQAGKKIVAGGPDEFMEVRHVVLEGSNYEIGKRLGELAKADGIKTESRGDPMINRLRRIYLAQNYPAHYERMRGVADAYGLSIDDDRYDFSALFQPMFISGGCSVVFYPGSITEIGHGILSRNYDFTTGTVGGRRTDAGQLPVMARPFVMEFYPDEGYASIAICAFDLLGGVLDGVNSEGLAVAIMGDDETIAKYGIEPSNEVGIHELLCMRYLLDTCANVEEAREAMLWLKHYYAFIPCHYIVADRSGDSFVFEFSPQRNQSRVIDGNGPQYVTNHLISNYKDISELPQGWSYDRFRTMHDAIQAKDRFSLTDIREINAQVCPMSPPPQNSRFAPGRTLWYALYDTELRSLDVSFYLGEAPPVEGEKGVRIHYSDPITFRLEP